MKKKLISLVKIGRHTGGSMVSCTYINENNEMVTVKALHPEFTSLKGFFERINEI